MKDKKLKYIYTQTFKDIDSGSLGLAGGKGANLGEMIKAGFPVPPGFIINTSAYNDFINSYSDMEEHYNNLEKLKSDELDEVRKVGSIIRETLEKIDIPEKLENELSERLTEFGEDNFFAVRSSATAEDLPGASFAGQQDTFLNIKGLENILINIRKCWVSLFTDRAILYRIEKGFSHRDVKLSAVIQQMVFPDSSGIMFTADPLSGHRNRISIDAGFGLGEALVSGLITPDLYKVNKSDFSIIKKDINEKKLRIISVSEGGTKTEILTKNQSTVQTLTDEQIIRLAEMGKKIEDHYGSPQDIEWCFEKDELFIVQSRPITSLFPVPKMVNKDESLHVYFSFGHFQVMTEPLPPMSHSIIKLFLPPGKNGYEGEYNPYILSAGGRLYFDLSPVLFRRIGRKIIPKMLQSIDPLMASAVLEIVERDEFLNGAGVSKYKSGLKTPVKWLLPIFLKGLKVTLWKDSSGRTEEIFDYLSNQINKIKHNLETIPNGMDRLLVGRVAVENILNTLIIVFPHIIPALISIKKIHKMFPGEIMAEEIIALQRGLKGNVTTEMDLKTGDLADIIKESPGLFEILSESSNITTTLLDLESKNEYKIFIREWKNFMELYGFRGIGEIDISRPRWKEDPFSIIKVIMGSIKDDTSGTHRTHYNNLAKEAENAAERLLSSVKNGMFGNYRVKKLKHLIKDYRNSLPLREHGKYFLMKLFGIIRELIIEEAKILLANNRIDELDDVWFFDYNELINVISNSSEDLKTRIHIRKKEMEIFRKMTPPRVITSDGEIPVAKHKGEFPEGSLPGAGVSAGTVEGVARVLMDPHSEVLNPGEILVAPFTDPAWTPLFINAAAVVIEVGGLMTHGSVIAREYGIPAVVSIENATKLIKTGQKIRVNGDLGYVEIMIG